MNAIQEGRREKRGPPRLNLRPKRDNVRGGQNNDVDSPPFLVPLHRVNALLK